MKESRILRYWEAFQKVSGVTGEHYLAEQFGYGKQVGDESAELIRIGKKTATTSALELYEKMSLNPKGSGAKFTQGECILYHELKLEVFR